MSLRRDAFRSRWATSHRLIATLLLSVLPTSMLSAQTGGDEAVPSSIPTYTIM